MTTFIITNVQLFSCNSANIAINDSFMLQLGNDGKWSIPGSDEACWNDDAAQDHASSAYDADELAEQLGLEADIDWLRENHICDEY